MSKLKTKILNQKLNLWHQLWFIVVLIFDAVIEMERKEKDGRSGNFTDGFPGFANCPDDLV